MEPRSTLEMKPQKDWFLARAAARQPARPSDRPTTGMASSRRSLLFTTLTLMKPGTKLEASRTNVFCKQKVSCDIIVNLLLSVIRKSHRTGSAASHRHLQARIASRIWSKAGAVQPIVAEPSQAALWAQSVGRRVNLGWPGKTILAKVSPVASKSRQFTAPCGDGSGFPLSSKLS